MPAGKKPARSNPSRPASNKTGGQPQLDSQTGKGGSNARSNAAPAAPLKAAPTGKTPFTPEVVMTLNHEQIAQRAYSIWVAKGRPHGLDRQNWSEAEEALKQELARRA